VFIGAGFDQKAISAALDDCLIGDEASFDPDLGRHLTDPFPAWQQAQHHHP